MFWVTVKLKSNSFHYLTLPFLLTLLISLAFVPVIFATSDEGLVHHPFRIDINTPAGGHGASTPTSSPPYTPAQIQAGYGFSSLYSSGITGKGQTIAIVDAYGSKSLVNDVKVFNTQFGLPQLCSSSCSSGVPSLTIVYAEPKQGSNSGWGVETSLDVEWAHAIAPQANIILVVAATNSFSNMFNAVNFVVTKGSSYAQVISMSWGGSEFSSETTYSTSIFQPAASEKITAVAASGDSGSEIYPSTDPYVLSVGGTTLTLSSSGAYVSGGEAAWSDSGGGYSTVFKEPLWQSSPSPGIPDPTGMRGNPDVAYDANPSTGVWIYDSTTYEGFVGWYGIGGTSIGAPQWAALVALTNQARGIQGFVNPAAYSIGFAGGTTYASNFHDITSGCNTSGYCTKGGWDAVTGWGSPIASALATDL